MYILYTSTLWGYRRVYTHSTFYRLTGRFDVPIGRGNKSKTETNWNKKIVVTPFNGRRRYYYIFCIQETRTIRRAAVDGTWATGGEDLPPWPIAHYYSSLLVKFNVSFITDISITSVTAHYRNEFSSRGGNHTHTH